MTPTCEEIIWELGHALWHAVRHDDRRDDQYDRMRTPVLGDLVIELGHRYSATAAVDPRMVGWFVAGDSFRLTIAPVRDPGRGFTVTNGIWIALPSLRWVEGPHSPAADTSDGLVLDQDVKPWTRPEET